jgi:hypothetical protein
MTVMIGFMQASTTNWNVSAAMHMSIREVTGVERILIIVIKTYEHIGSTSISR